MRIKKPTSLRELIGQLFVCGFSGKELPKELGSFFEKGFCGGTILFSRNIENPIQLRNLTLQISAIPTSIPLWIGVDQEGGRVARLKKPFTELPPFAVLGKLDSEDDAETYGKIIGQEAFSAGFNLVFSPVLDVNTNPNNPVIGNRSISDQPKQVGLLGWRVAKGLMDSQIMPCGKHFPGHGDTTVDSHLALPHLSHDWERLRTIEWLPFQHCIEQNIPALMSAHVLFPQLDSKLPATLSPDLLGTVLRKELGFEGLIFSDDIEMKGVFDHFSLEEIVVLGVQAGIDQFLLCHHWEWLPRAIEALEKAVAQNLITKERLWESWTRIARAKQQYATQASSILPQEMEGYLQQQTKHHAFSARLGEVWNPKGPHTS